MKNNKIKLTVNNLEIFGEAGQTILEVINNNAEAFINAGISAEIPTLCHDERVEAFGSCGICTVEIENNPRLIRSCSTAAADNMVIITDSERIHRNRKAALELLLSDHEGDCKPPCALACPAETDCQKYVKLIADGDCDGAKKLITETNPFPASIGRVCPRPCEDACRRELVEEPVSIAALKIFADEYANPEACKAKPRPESGKKIAVIGGGPGGLSAAYFLRLKGHAVTVFDAMPEPGGMLRYGIPEYRLPKAILRKETDFIKNTGVEILSNTRIGKDLSLNELREKYDAVIIAVGAWKNTPLRCKGENLSGVVSGIDFLRKAAENNAPDISGLKVAVVGGGNTAMDACRTAIRLGADKVYNIYRRTRNEMPAEEEEIKEAEEEGVIFKFLTNPIEIIGEENNPIPAVKSLRLQIMKLGEPDASGRCAPVAVEGQEETLAVDFVISAIGQKFDPEGLETIELTKWGTVKTDSQTFSANIISNAEPEKINIKSAPIFALGDAANDGADIAISAIGEARKAAEAVDEYLKGEKISKKPPYYSKEEVTAEDFADTEKLPRLTPPHRSASERRNDFKEINGIFKPEQARKEASRCLECGCLDFYDCKLIKYANMYDVKPEKFGVVEKAEKPEKPEKAANADLKRLRDGERLLIPNVTQTPEKCVLCGLCVRICEEEVGAGVLGFVGRGFDTAVKPSGDLSPCENCGKCAEICPTGALIT